MFKYSILPR